MLERRFNKNQILERYLNEVYFGEGAYGIHAAAETYFGKQPSDLTLGGKRTARRDPAGTLGPFSLCESKAILGAPGLGAATNGKPGLHF